MAVAAILVVAMVLTLGIALQDVWAQAGAPPVQIFFVPLPEEQIHVALVELAAGHGGEDVIGETMHSVVSIVAALDHTVIYYDHWEDGYEPDISHPLQGSTEIWGDGDPTNGAPPGIPDDTIEADDVIVLQRDIGLPRDPGEVSYDGRDKFGATKVVVVTRAEWAIEPGTVLAGAVEVYDTDEYGTAFEVPVGEDVDAHDMFGYVSLLVMAAEDGTTIEIDVDGDGGVDVVETLDQGEGYQVNGGVECGASVTASHPVQVHLITGYPNGYYESRWYSLYPVEQWGDSYFSPVGSNPISGTTDVQETSVFVYNPGSGPITVNYETEVGSGSLTVPPRSVVQYDVPENSAAHFYTEDGSIFFAITAVGADPESDPLNNSELYDWGFSLMPETALSTAVIIGWGPGNGAPDPTDYRNGSPAWVTAVQPTTLYVDYDGDRTTGPLIDPDGNHYDVAYSLAALQSLRVFDNNDNDQTGMRMYTLDGTRISAAWGQDPSTADPGNPYLDLGTTVLPLHPRLVVDKVFVGSGGPEGGPNYITFTIVITNAGSSVIDVLPLVDTYDPYYLSFVSATPYPDEDADDGTLTWYDLTTPSPHGFNRNLAPDESFLLTTVFQVVHDITTTVNTASVAGVVDIYNNTANEDEDEAIVIGVPTAVELLYFRVGAVAGRAVRLEWETAVEVDTFGFNLYRAPVADRSRATPLGFVPARGGGAYAYTDTAPADGHWWYWLADVDTALQETFHGPVQASVGALSLPHRLYLPMVFRGDIAGD